MADAVPRLPDAVIDHIASEALDAWYRALFVAERWSDDARDAIEEAVADVYHKRVTLDAFVSRVRDAVGDAARGTAVAIEILGNDFLKIEDYLGVDIPAYMRSLGGNPAKYVREVVAGDVVAGVIARVGIAPNDPVLAKRVAGVASSFLAGVRDRAETIDVLTRGAKIGGAGLDGGAADQLVTALAAELATLRSSGAVIRSHDGRPPETSSFHLVKPTTSGLIQPEDESEIERIRAAVPGTAHRDRIAAAIERILAEVGAKFSDPAFERRFRSAVESRIRDIRDHQETLDLLTRSQSVGGLGVPTTQAEKLLVMVEEEFRTLHARTDGARIGTDGARSTGATILTPHASRLTPPIPAPTTAIVVQLVHPVPPSGADSQKPIADSPPSKPIADSQKPIAAARHEIAALPSPPAIIPPKLPKPPQPIADSRKPIATPKREIAPPPPQRHESEVVSREKATVPPPSATAVPSPSTLTPHASRLTPSSATGRPRVEDIRAVPSRLVGPIEELGRLTVQDFRSIAPTPAASAAKIAEKLALLEKDAYTKRAEGTRALRGSPLFQEYADVVAAALAAKRSAEAEVQARLAQRSGALTLEEFRALRDLSAQLRS